MLQIGYLIWTVINYLIAQQFRKYYDRRKYKDDLVARVNELESEVIRRSKIGKQKYCDGHEV
jgi:hypothetical protein